MATNKRVNDVNIRNARIMFRNFSGRESQFNDAGERNFCVIIDDPEEAEMLNNDGWKVRVLAPREEGEPPLHYIPVKVKYDRYPPSVYLISGRKRTLLDESSIGCLDYAEIEHIDMVLSPYSWEKAGRQGIKAYLKIMYVTIKEDPFAADYAYLDDPDMERPF